MNDSSKPNRRDLVAVGALAALGVTAASPVRAKASSTSALGLSKRELQKKMSWLLRNPPSDPDKLAKMLGDAFVTLIDENNQKLAKQLAASADTDDDF